METSRGADFSRAAVQQGLVWRWPGGGADSEGAEVAASLPAAERAAGMESGRSSREWSMWWTSRPEAAAPPSEADAAAGSAAQRALASSAMCASRAGPCSGTPWGAFLGRVRGEGRSGAALRFARAGFFPSGEGGGGVQRAVGRGERRPAAADLPCAPSAPSLDRQP